MTRKSPDLHKPLPPRPFVSRFIIGIIAAAAFGMLVVYWR
jgi:hypothetical protein